MIEIFLATMVLQTADLEPVRLCVGYQTVGFRRADGRIWWSPEDWSGPGEREPFNPELFPTVHDRPWFAARTPLNVDGRTYEYVGEHQITWAFNRYYREHPDYQGVIAATPFPDEDHSTLYLLSNPVGCVFAAYRRTDPAD
jgi:hypothetical protein